MPREDGSNDAEAAISADHAVIDVSKHQGLVSLPGFPFEVRTSASTREQAGLLKPVARDLRYFEAFYPYIEPLTYVWYQFRFTMMAKAVVDAAGPDVLRRLWDAFAVSDEGLAGMLGDRVHPAAGQWLASWNEPQST